MLRATAEGPSPQALPRVTPMVQPVPTSASDESSRRAASILVIDGNEEHQALSVAALGRRGYAISVADSAKEALEAARDRRFDVIVLAQKLRGVSGLRVLRMVAEQARGIPIIFVVPEGSEDVALKALAEGATGYLVKTARYNELLPIEVEDQLAKVRVGKRLKVQEKILEETEARYREIVTGAGSPIVVVDTSGKLVASNEAMATLSGYSSEDLAEVGLRDLLTEWSPETAKRLFEAAQGRGRGAFEFALRRKDGAERTIEVTPRLVRREGDILGLELLARDVTESKRQERELKDLYSWLAAIYEATNDAILLADVNLRPVQWNARALELFQARGGSLAGRSADEWLKALAMRAEDPEPFLGSIRMFQDHPEAVLEGRLQLVSPERRTYSRQSVPVRNPEGAIIGRMFTFRDVTEPLRAAEALHDIREQLATVIASAPVILFVVDRNGIFTLSEGRGLEALGLKPGQVVGQSVYDLYGPLIPGLKERLARVFSGQTVLATDRVGDLWFETRYVPLLGAEDQVVGVIGVGTDITERRRTADALQRRDAILDAIRFAADRFLRASRWEGAIQPVLEHLGRAAEVSRVWIFRNSRRPDGVLVTREPYEWAAPGIASMVDPPNRPSRPYVERGFSRWEELLGRGEVIVGNSKDLPETERKSLEAQGIRSIAVVPILVGSEWWGSIGFDQCDGERTWTSPEVDVLKTAAGTLSSAILRAQTEEALGESETRFRLILEQAPALVWSVDRELRFTASAGSGMPHVDGRPAAVPGQSVFEYFGVEDSDYPPVAAHRRALQGESVSADFPFGRRWFHVHLEPLRDETGLVNGVVGVALDISPRVEAEHEIRERAKQQAAVAQFGLAALAGADLPALFSQAANRVADTLNVGYASVLELRPGGEEFIVRAALGWGEDEIGRTLPARPEATVAGYAVSIAKPVIVEDFEAETRFPEPPEFRRRGIRSGLTVIIPGRKRPFGVLGAQSAETRRFSEDDVHFLQAIANTLATAIERKRTEDERQEATVSLRAVVESSPAAVVAVDRDGSLTLWNPAAERIFGWRPEEVLGKPLPTVPPDRKEEHMSLRRRATQGVAVADFETRRMRKDGSLLDVRVSVAPLYDATGRVTGTMGSITDITERKRAEKVQDAIYRISEAAASAANLDELFKAIHGIVGELMDARNFYIALHDEGTDTLNFGYFVDEKEPPPPPQKLKRGLTEYILRTGKPLLASPEVFDRLMREGEVVLVGQNSIDWLGVPLIAAERPIGVLVVQSYTEGVRYTEEDKEILLYVSTQVASAIERKRSEAALRESEARYRRIAENAEDVIYRYRYAEPRGFEYVSPVVTKITGYTPEEHYADPELGFKLVYPEDRALLERAFTDPQVFRMPLQLRWVRKDGRIVWTEQRNVPIFDEKGEMVAVEGIARDITDRKRAEEALRDSEERYRLLFEDNPQPMWVYDAETLRFLAVNAAAVHHYGYSRDEFLQMTIKDIRPPEDVAALVKAVGDADRGRQVSGLWRHVKKDGTVIDVDIVSHGVEFGDRLARLVLVNDVTARRRAEEQLARSERRFRTLFEAAADGIVLLDRQGTILDVNPAAETIIGAPRAALLNRNLGEIIPADELERARQYMRDVLRGRVRKEPFSIDVTTLDGHRRFLDVHSQAVREEGGEPYVEMILRDVTQPREMQRRLMESERLASIGSMAGYVAHEINNPLANISLLVASAERKAKDPELLEKLAKINAQRRQAASIISDILSFSKQRQIRAVESDLRVILDGAIDQVAPYRKEGVAVHRSLGDEPVLAEVDPLQIQEVFVNLLKNALEATASGSVSLEIEERGDTLAVRVADTGAGIPPQLMDRLFEPFFTTKKQIGGTGLGLPLCKNVVAAHGGQIQVSSEVGKGSTFTVLIPRRQPPKGTGS